MRSLAIYWEALVQMFQDPVETNVTDEQGTGEVEKSCLAAALTRIGLLDQRESVEKARAIL